MTETTRPLTAKQSAVLEFIRTNAGLYGPTIREIAAAMHIKSTNGVVCHLNALERKGLIRREKLKSRAIEVLP